MVLRNYSLKQDAPKVTKCIKRHMFGGTRLPPFQTNGKTSGRQDANDVGKQPPERDQRQTGCESYLHGRTLKKHEES